MIEWSTACPDWERRIVQGQSLIPFAPLFPQESEAAVAIFKALRMVDAAGSPLMGEVARQWVFDFVAAIFGAYDAESGRRLINEFFLLISKKNGKSTTAAGIMLTALLMNWRKSAELTILAPTIEIAKNSADPAMDMVNEDPELLALLKPIPHLRMIEHRTTGATLKIVTADERIVGGSKSAFVLIDEYWLFGKMANARGMLQEATGGLTSRPEGFVIKLSTHSDDPPAGVFKSDLERFRDIRDGKLVAPRSLGVLYEFPKKMLKAETYKKSENFYVTNPNLGASVDEQVLLDKQAEATAAGPAAVAGFYAKHLNVEIGMGLHADRWPGAENWLRQTDKKLSREELLLRSEVVVVGIDGGGLDDLFSLVMIGRDAKTKDWLAWSHSWCHKGVLERRQSIASVLIDFKESGHLTIVDDRLNDITEIVELISDVKGAGLLNSVAVDPAGLGELVDALAEIDVSQDDKHKNLIGVGQGFKLMTAIKTAERKLANKSFWHSDDALFAWAVGNLKIEPMATAIRATKQNAGDAKIDPAMAMFNAVTVMALNPSAPRKREYQVIIA